MQRYALPPNRVKEIKGQAFRRFVIVGFGYAIFLFINHSFDLHWHRPYATFRPLGPYDNMVLRAFSCGFQAFIWTVAMWMFTPKPYEAVLDVDNEYIASGSREVRRGNLRTIYQRKNGIILSKRGRLGTFWLGGIWVPRELPQYAEIETLASSWLS